MTSKFPFRHSKMSLSLILTLIFIAAVKSEPEVSEIDNTGVLELPLSKIISTRRTRYVIDDIQTTVDTKIDGEPIRQAFGAVFETKESESDPVSNRDTRNVADFEAFSIESPNYAQEELTAREGAGNFINQQDPRVQEVDVVGWFE